MGEVQKFDWVTSTASTLDWWREAGVDVAIAEEPRNWLAPAPVEASPRDVATPRSMPQPPAIAPRASVPMPTSLAAFDAWRRSDNAPDAHWPGKHLFAQGAPAAGLCVVVEMPEREDGDADMLMSGAVGKLFDRMLAAIGQDRSTIYLIPMCTARPGAGRIPDNSLNAIEAALRHHVDLASPRRVLMFGNAVSRALVGADIAQSRGALRPVNQNAGQQAPSIQAIASYHPRFLLERPAAKAEAWKDLLLLIQGIEL